jgi:endonuclease I
MKKLALFFILITTVASAQIPPGYYNSAQGLTGSSLKIALHNIIDNHTQISYNNLWTAFQKTDRKPNGKVWDMYSDVPGGTLPYQYSFVSDQCGNYSGEGNCYNREHSWPKSWFNDVAGPYSDLFHVVATDGYVNNRRDNYPFGNVAAPTWTSLNGSKLGPCSNLGYNQVVFEPIDEYKGDFARGYFYMSTRYYSEDATWTNSPATNKSTILPWQMNVLLQWHHLDPVSAKEIARNDSIYYRFQHNRNPFIDNPQWADSIWTMDNSVFVKEHSQSNSFDVFPNPVCSSFEIRSLNSLQGITRIVITDLNGHVIEDRNYMFSGTLEVKCDQWLLGVYFIQLISENSSGHFKVVKM